MPSSPCSPPNETSPERASTTSGSRSSRRATTRPDRSATYRAGSPERTASAIGCSNVATRSSATSVLRSGPLVPVEPVAVAPAGWVTPVGGVEPADPGSEPSEVQAPASSSASSTATTYGRLTRSGYRPPARPPAHRDDHAHDEGGSDRYEQGHWPGSRLRRLGGPDGHRQEPHGFLRAHLRDRPVLRRRADGSTCPVADDDHTDHPRVVCADVWEHARLGEPERDVAPTLQRVPGAPGAVRTENVVGGGVHVRERDHRPRLGPKDGRREAEHIDLHARPRRVGDRSPAAASPARASDARHQPQCERTHHEHRSLELPRGHRTLPRVRSSREMTGLRVDRFPRAGRATPLLGYCRPGETDPPRARLAREPGIPHTNRRRAVRRHAGGSTGQRGRDAMKILVASPSKHGPTEEIGAFIAQRLRERGLDADAIP